ncbi:MAG: carbohydrate ABC transporter permease [Chloroflexi bacterium]|nr:carbohydrate ABC transporter permease [Chloroflexota bacterium]
MSPALPAAGAKAGSRFEPAYLAGWVVLLSALVVSIAPFLYLFSLSLMDNQQIFNGTLIAWPVRLANYPEAWVATKIGTLYWNSIYISGGSMIVTVAISALAGYGLGRLEFFGKAYIYALILIGLTIPIQIALIPLFVNLRWLGLMNTPLALIGPYTAFGLAFGTYIMKAFFEELPRELEEAARIDGANDFRIFWQIMLPLTRPAIATISIFLFLQNWNEFLFALTFITDSSMRTLPTGIYALISSEFYGNYGLLAAALVLFSMPVLILYFIFQQQFIEGLTAGALKH